MTLLTDLPRARLAELVAQHGTGTSQDAAECAARLTSEYGLEYGDECAALIAAIDAEIVAELQHSLLSSVPRSALLRKLSQRLANGSNLPPYLAQWSVECWALALGVVRTSDELLSLKLETLVPLLDAGATNETISTDMLERLLGHAADRGIDESGARAYISRYAARRGWRIAEPASPSARGRRAAAENWTARRSAKSPGTQVPSAQPVAPVMKDATSTPVTVAAPMAPGPLQTGPYAAAATMLRRGSATAVFAVILAAIAAITIDRLSISPPASSSSSAPQLPPKRTAQSEQRRVDQVEREQGFYNAAHGKREALQAYIGTCEICTYRDAALQEKIRLDAADREERTYKAARGNKEALQNYIATCTICADQSAAIEEKARIDATAEHEEQTYIAARGNKQALQAYIGSCTLCARRAAAQSEIIAIEATPPRRIAATVNVCGKLIDFVIEATGAPEAYRGFLGVWTGAAWNSRVCGGLIVRRVASDGTADVVYIYGPLPGEKFLWKAQHPVAMVSFKKLTFEDEDGSSFVFNQTYDNTLHGFFSSKEGAKLDAILTRELSSVP